MASIGVGKNSCSGGVCVLCWLLAIDLESRRSSNMATAKAEIAVCASAVCSRARSRWTYCVVPRTGCTAIVAQREKIRCLT
jgi:hypothetical protein